MKLRHIGQAVLAGAVSLGITIGIAACGQDNTIDYVYVTNAKNSPGQIDIYLVDRRVGTLTPLKSSPVSSGGRNPQSIAAMANGNYLYVANHDDNTIVEFAIGSDATLTQKNVYQAPGSGPTALTIDSTGTYLYVTVAFQSGFGAKNPGPGELVIYPIKQSDGTLGSPLTDSANGGTSFFPTCNNPVAVSVLNNVTVTSNSTFTGAVYVVNDPGSQPPKISDTTDTGIINYGTSTANGCSASTGQLTAYTVNYTGGSTPTLSSVAAVAGSPFAAGSAPDAIATDIQDRFVYVTDLLTNQLLGYVISGPGVLTPINSGPFTTGNYPDAITIDPTNSYIYVANYRDHSISGFQISGTGAPSGLSASTYLVTGGPTAVYVEPSNGRYVYTSDFVDNTVVGASLNPNTGALTGVQNSPFPASGEPTSITAVTHGSHSTEILPVY